MSSGSKSSGNTRDKGKSRDPLVGTVLDGRFHIDDVLGSGGMSVVYLATQTRVNRQVAIKTLKLAMDSKEIYRERFDREISLLCSLAHPHIVTVYDCIFDEEQQPFVVMDYLRGRSLEALIKEEGALDVDRFARIAVQVCSALEYAHKNGVIHRDLKPGNLVLMDDEMDFVKVVDFGLAKLNEEGRKLTQSGELWGSPPYLSPEQCIGKTEDARSDIYSFGCVMYEMLTGKDPFHTGTTIYELIQLHVNTPPPKMCDINPFLKMPAELEAVIFKAMAKDPKDRYQSAQDLSNAIVKACAEGNSRESGNLKIMAGGSSGGQPNPVSQASVGMNANNFNMALDPMAGMSIEDAFLDKSSPKTTETTLPDSTDKAAPTRQLARERFSDLESEREPKKTSAGKMIIVGFAAVLFCAIALFAVASMKSGKTETASNSTAAPTMKQNAPKTDETVTGTSPSQASPAATKQPENVSAPASTDGSPNLSPSIRSAPPPVRAKTPQKVRVAPRIKQPVNAKRAAPSRPATSAGAGKSSKPWDALQGMRSK